MDEETQQIENYLREIAHVPALTDEEVRQLVQDRAALLQRVAQAHLSLVVPIAQEYAGQGRSLVDLVLKGNVALLHAIETFDTTTQEPFKAYAEKTIRAAIAQDQA